MAESLALSRLLQLASPMLPVGAYGYSQGLEWAIECGGVSDLPTAQTWINDVLHTYQSHFELPVLHRLYAAWQAGDTQAAHEWDAFYKAGRDTAEGLAETKQMGYSLVRLLGDLKQFPEAFLEALKALHEPAFPTVYAAVAQAWQIPSQDMLQGYAWSWLENQVSVCMKTVPLGQVAGQKMLFALGETLPSVVSHAIALPEEEISNFNPLLSIAGCLHETQYSRLFRS